MNEVDFRSLDLRGFNLRLLDLQGARFDRADVSGASFYGATLQGSSFRQSTAKGTVFTDCNLDQTDFTNANLIGAVFAGAKLRRTTFRSADICIANFSSATLLATSFENAKINDTCFSNLNLTHAILTDMVFQGPCDVGTSTLEMTAEAIAAEPTLQGPIEHFLRACGASDRSLEFFGDSIGRPIQWFTAFISYAHADKRFAQYLYAQLQGRGIRCWLDEKDLIAGARILDAVNQAIRVHDRILLCCSVTSLSSWWVKDEVRKAQEKERETGKDVIIPLLLDDHLLSACNDGMASDLRSRLAVDFSNWSRDASAFDNGVQRIAAALSRTAKHANQ